MKQLLSRIRSLIVLLAVFLSASVVHAQRELSQNMDGFNSASRLTGNVDERPVKDSTVVERTVPKDYTQWKMNPLTGLMDSYEPDTLPSNFFRLHMTEGMKGTYNSLGNMGSPRLSRIFMERQDAADFIFDSPYDFFIKNPQDFRYTDTKTPHVNLTYFKGGNKQTGEEHIKGYFAANFGKNTGIGIDMDYLLGRGRYDNQSTSMFDARAYGYHHREIYNIHGSFNVDEIKVAENGGITDDRFITRPEAMAQGKKQYAPEDIPVVLYSNWNNLKRKQFSLVQSLDIRRNVLITDSIADTVLTHTEYTTVSTAAHTFQAGTLQRRFISYYTPENYYQNQYLRADSLDRFRDFYMDNTISLSLHEGFSKWAVAGMTAYARHELRSYTMSDTLQTGIQREFSKRVNEFNLVAGGIIERETGKNVALRFQGETVLLGEDFADFDLNGQARISVPFLQQNISLTGKATLKAQNPTYFMRHYHSEHIWWDREDLNKEITTRMEGILDIEKTRTRLWAGVANIGNYTYLADNAAAKKHAVAVNQASGSLQVININLDQNFRLGPFNWENSLTYQFSSDKDILPLPDFNVYSNAYLKFTYAKQLRIELGADMTWFSEYYAPDYSAAAGQFVLQNSNDRVKVGGYPLANVYANCTLRGVRFYVMMYHVNDGALKNRNAFWAPHYPMAPQVVKFGLSWTFYD